jgi:hypothetical protein
VVAAGVLIAAFEFRLRGVDLLLDTGRDRAWAVLAGWGRPSRWGGRGGPDGWIFSRLR